MSRMRLGQSAADADTLTRARPLATSTESVSCHTEENLGVDQWYKSMSLGLYDAGGTSNGAAYTVADLAPADNALLLPYYNKL